MINVQQLYIINIFEASYTSISVYISFDSYRFGGGIQGQGHPNPGHPYRAHAFPRRAFLPDNERGNKVSPSRLSVCWICLQLSRALTLF